jgi:prolipoprotein diacylglyceryltransferase
MPEFISRLCTRAGDVFVLYIIGYTSGRLWIETLRIDEANTLFGLRVNIWVSLCVLLCASLYLYRNFRRGSMKKEAQAS